MFRLHGSALALVGFSFCPVFSVMLFAQNRTLTGTIKFGDAPIKGVKVAVQGTKKVAYTDAEGKYSGATVSGIDLQEYSSLSFRFFKDNTETYSLGQFTVTLTAADGNTSNVTPGTP